MAVVDMKRLLLVAARRSREDLLLSLQRMGCVQLSTFQEEDAESTALLAQEQRFHHTEQAIARARFAITRLSRFANEKTGMLTPKPAASLQALSPTEDQMQQAEALLNQIEALERQSGELRGRETRLRSQLELMGPWLTLDIDKSHMVNSRHSRQFLGALPRAALPRLEEATAGWPLYIETISQIRENLNIWAIVHSSKAVELQELFKELNFSPAQLGDAEGTPAMQAQALEQALDSLAAEQASLQEGMVALAKQLPALRLYHDQLLSLRERQAAQQKLLHTRETFLLRGWLPATMEQAFLASMAKDYPEAVITISEPDGDEEPPVLLQNNRFSTPFEGVVEGFSLPAYGSLDPTAALAPFFACFFGMMVSDAGYGLMMMILVPLLIHLMKPSKAGRKLFLMIGIGGVFTLFWGFMYNTWFGFAPLQQPILDPVNRPLEVMMLCIAVGAVHLVVGLLLGAVQHIRRGKYIDVVYDQLSWLMLLAGIGLMVVPSLAPVGKWLALIGVGIILAFAGREKSRNPFKRLISGLGALYGISSWLSDLLSYLRLFGMGLATGVIGMVFNILIGMVFKTGPVGWVLGAVLFVGCHLFNAGINILGAYVHSSRLQYIEFFSKFYEDGGLAFRPLSHKPRYVRISDA